MNSLKVLVTGGAGFIGSNIAREAIRRGFDVRILDTLSTGSLANLEGLHVEFIAGDVRDKQVVKKATTGVEYVFHEAATSSSQMFLPHPREGVEINLQGFLNVMECSSENHVKKVVYAMTSSSYGNNPVPWKEEMMTAATCPNAYAFSLFARDFFGRLYSQTQGLENVGLAYFSVYGPYEKPKAKYANIISQFLWSMMNNEPPVLYGDGKQSRDFIHVDDVVEANFKAIETSASGEVFNVGTGKETSMVDVADLLNDVLGKKIAPKFVPNPIQGYCYHTRADTTKAQRVLKFKAQIPLRRALRSVAEFYGNEL